MQIKLFAQNVMLRPYWDPNPFYKFSDSQTTVYTYQILNFFNASVISWSRGSSSINWRTFLNLVNYSWRCLRSRAKLASKVETLLERFPQFHVKFHHCSRKSHITIIVTDIGITCTQITRDINNPKDMKNHIFIY